MSLQGRLDKSRVTCQRYALSKLCDLSLDLNESRVDAERMDVGMLFQNFGPATEKARSPNRAFDFQTFRSPLTSDRRRHLNPILNCLGRSAPAPALDVDYRHPDAVGL